MDTTFDHTQERFILYLCESILKLLEKNSMSGLLKAFFFFYPDLNTNSMTVARSYQDVLVKGVPFVLL